MTVDTDAKTVHLTIVDKLEGTSYFDGDIKPTGKGDFAGIQLLRGRGVGTMSVDNIKAK